MEYETVVLIAKQFWQNAFRQKAFYRMLFIVCMILLYAAYSGWKTYTTQSAIRLQYQYEARKSWENNPDKHPHRMAHFGSFAFRRKHPLSLFDFGLESFSGNAVYLEAHQQNTINFSEASFSTGLLRFGEISMAMLLQVLFPLIIFFLGYYAIAAERERGTLKIMLTQGANWKELLWGKSLGLMGLSVVLFLPVLLVSSLSMLMATEAPLTSQEWSRYASMLVGYLLFFQILSVLTVLVSAFSRSSKDALIKLLAMWLFFIVLLPKTTQALGTYFYPSPAKVVFQTAIEKELIQKGDSHNPDDPYYMALKDSLLRAYHVDSVQQLPFNYSGLVMREGEKTSAEIYNRHMNELLQTYRKQNALTRVTAFLNPYVAIRNISMALAGTDFESYFDFQKQAETYRYGLAQEMNELQMEFISNKESDDKPHVVSSAHWKEFPDFKHEFVSFSTAIRSVRWSVLALISWNLVALVLVMFLSQKVKTI